MALSTLNSCSSSDTLIIFLIFIVSCKAFAVCNIPRNIFSKLFWPFGGLEPSSISAEFHFRQFEEDGRTLKSRRSPHNCWACSISLLSFRPVIVTSKGRKPLSWPPFSRLLKLIASKILSPIQK